MPRFTCRETKEGTIVGSTWFAERPEVVATDSLISEIPDDHNLYFSRFGRQFVRLCADCVYPKLAVRLWLRLRRDAGVEAAVRRLDAV
jgi:hypothetical protein